MRKLQTGLKGYTDDEYNYIRDTGILVGAALATFALGMIEMIFGVTLN